MTRYPMKCECNSISHGNLILFSLFFGCDSFSRKPRTRPKVSMRIREETQPNWTETINEKQHKINCNETSHQFENVNLCCNFLISHVHYTKITHTQNENQKRKTIRFENELRDLYFFQVLPNQRRKQRTRFNVLDPFNVDRYFFYSHSKCELKCDWKWQQQQNN